MARITMAQKQCGNPSSLELHLSDVEEKREKRLPKKGLDISWVLEATKKAVTDLFYASTVREGQCPEGKCEYTTLSRCKLLDHIVTHCITYTTNCNYVTSRRDSAVKHLRVYHCRRGFIIQADTDS